MRFARSLFLIVTALALMAAGVTPAQASPDPEPSPRNDAAAQDGAAEQVIEQVQAEAAAGGEGLEMEEITSLDDLGPMPWLSFTADQNPRAVEAWRAVAAQLPDRVQVPKGKKNIGGRPLTVKESESVGETGGNDTIETGDRISRRFGSRFLQKGVVTISGSLSGGVVRPPIDGDCESVEDDGSIPQANPTPAAEIQVALCIGEIGDGPFGDTSGDVDFYSYGEVEEGTVLILDVFHIAGSLDPVESVIGIYDGAGNLLASVEDTGSGEGDTFIEVIAPATGEYFAAVAGCCDLSTDPFDSASGQGVGDTGTYEVFVVAFPPPCVSVEDDGSIGLANETNIAAQGFDFCTGIIGDGQYGPADTDFYAVGAVDEGSIIFTGTFAFEEPVATVVGIYDAAGNLVASAESSGDPEAPEFLEYVVETAGDYFVAVAGCCQLQADPNDPATGVASDQAGLYELLIEAFPPPPPPCESVEDDGAIPVANEVTGSGDDVLFVGECYGAVGDGPQADANGDVDFFRTRPLPAGRLLIVDFADLFGEAAGAGELTIGIYNEAGDLLATGQDDPAQSGPTSQFFSYTVPTDGVYYVAVGGAMPTDPFNPATGTDTEITSGYSLMFIVDTTEDVISGGLTEWPAGAAAAVERSTEAKRGPLAQLMADMAQARNDADGQAGALAKTADVVDIDYFLVKLRKGDAISGGFDNARTVGIIDPAGVQRSGAEFNPSFIYPADSPLRHDRRNGFDHVATTDGIHAVFVTDGIAEYEGELRVTRSGLANEWSRNQQIIFLDFDGATIGGDIFGTGVDAELSPLADFLPLWGLGPSDEDAVIDATIDAVIETLDTDLRIEDGRNGNRDETRRGGQFDVEILNSRDNGDRWGDPNVTRIVVGGTIDQLQIPTIGIAQSIDPGNLESEETGVVLLDIMSEPAGSEASINTYGLAPGIAKADFVGFVIGNISAHEAGHLIGNWHQETFNEVEALMDAGGDFPAIAGVGDDGVFGTADDTDPDFVQDVFEPFEGFTGIEDTAGRSAFGLSTGLRRIPRDRR